MIGAADEFWRVRLTRVDTGEGLDFEWHEDILYREPHPEPEDDVELWVIEALRVDDYDTIVAIATLRDRSEAEAMFQRVSEDLSEMTKNRFEDEYMSPSGPADESSR